MSHVKHMNKGCQTYEWYMSNIYRLVVTRIVLANEANRTYRCAMSGIISKHVTQIIESWHIYKWSMSHKWVTSWVKASDESSECWVVRMSCCIVIDRERERREREERKGEIIVLIFLCIYITFSTSHRRKHLSTLFTLSVSFYGNLPMPSFRRCLSTPKRNQCSNV